MRHLRNTTALLLGLSIGIAGCALLDRDAPPEAVYSELQDGFTLAVSLSIGLKDAGVISQDDWDSIFLPAIREGSALLDEMKLALDRGEFSRVDLLRSAIVRTILRINEERALRER